MSQPQTNVHARRFVQSAWMLLIAQLIFAAIAVAVTGWAAFRVAGQLSGNGPAADPAPAAEAPTETGPRPGGLGGDAPAPSQNDETGKPGDQSVPGQQTAPQAPPDMYGAPPAQPAPQAAPDKPAGDAPRRPIDRRTQQNQEIYTP